MQSESGSSWSGFLPKQAIIMARRSELARRAEARPALSGEGDPGAQLVFVSQAGALAEAPRALLGKMIEAMGLTEQQIYLCDVATFGLERTHLNPKVIVTLGEPATQALLEMGVRASPTFDPAFLISHPESKRKAWSDLQAVARELGLTLPSKKG
jgi:uracil-DNA glycosylase